MTSIVIHLSKNEDGEYVCSDSICDAYGCGSSPQVAISRWAEDVFNGYKFLVDNKPLLSPELEQKLNDVQHFFFPDAGEGQ